MFARESREENKRRTHVLCFLTRCDLGTECRVNHSFHLSEYRQVDDAGRLMMPQNCRTLAERPCTWVASRETSELRVAEVPTSVETTRWSRAEMRLSRRSTADSWPSNEDVYSCVVADLTDPV